MQKYFIRVNSSGHVVCRATKIENLHGDGADYLTDIDVYPGDKFLYEKTDFKDVPVFDDKGNQTGTEQVKDKDVGTHEKHPENYPQENATERESRLINEKIREMARAALIAEGKISE